MDPMAHMMANMDDVMDNVMDNRAQGSGGGAIVMLTIAELSRRRVAADNWEIGVETKSGHVSPRSVTSQWLSGKKEQSQ
ncbi:hypothetical protein AK812_SmicGene1037 [Symbiodinium microadriaticum]|uniref:Uncharacterized protein n=1 Tax=Symbiodinium microadriaticum TaxID=2951 RepID=A0A1Q9F4Z5_SYMMI|nr:hypothetical protein AK812_SmicGene1037 [Symbiodinium microadriaticum]